VNKTVVIHQPDFLPHLAFFHRLIHADLFVILDTAQFVDGTSRSWMHRDKIKTPKGEKWLSLSVRRPHRDTAIRDVKLSNEVDWRAANLNLLRANYRKAAHFDDIYPHLENLYATDCTKLMDFNLKSIQLLLELFGIRVESVMASSLGARGAKNELLVDILRETGATRYLSGEGARAYFDPRRFEAAGIEVAWHNFVHPVYPQLHGDFIPYLSSIDLLFNCGIDKSKAVLGSIG
jgi:hypothetical protein